MTLLDQLRIWQAVRTFGGIALCCSCALLSSILFRGRPDAVLVPFAFLLVICLGVILGGSAAGVAGSVGAALVFAFYMFRPFHKLLISDGTAQGSLAWMTFAGIAASWLAAGPRPRKNTNGADRQARALTERKAR